jgi:hypothetical protein
MGLKGKFEAEMDKANAKNQSAYEKTKADFESDGTRRKIKHAGSDIKKNLKVAKANAKEKLN